MFRITHNEWFRSGFFAGGFYVRVFPEKRETSSHIPFWVEPISIFGSFLVTAFISSLHMLTMPSSLATYPH